MSSSVLTANLKASHSPLRKSLKKSGSAHVGLVEFHLLVVFGRTKNASSRE
jgi:hypothetical protein